jgi:hypothetical protein
MRELPFWDKIKALFEPVLLFVMRSPWEGAHTTLFTLLDDSVPLHNGGYYSNCALTSSWNPQRYNETLAKELWTKSESILNKLGF